MKELNKDPEHYARIKYEGKWYALVPEVYQASVDDVRHRCVACAFHQRVDDTHESHCAIHKVVDDEFRLKGVDCDNDDAPCIFADVSNWEQHIADRVAARMS